MLLWSVIIWTFFEAVNLVMQNWYYSNVVPITIVRWLGYSFAYATVLPGIFETVELLETMGFFRKSKVKPLSINRRVLTVLFCIGIVFLITPLLFPRYCFPLIWGSLIFLLEPINYLRGGKSLLRKWEEGRAGKLLLLLTAGMICGILWEFWNFWARTKWVYTVPFFDELKVFEMPVLGFLGFPPFAVECYVIYNFISLFRYHRGWEEDSYGLNNEKRVSWKVISVTALTGLLFCTGTFYFMDRKTVNSYWSTVEELETIPSEFRARLRNLEITTPANLLDRTKTAHDINNLANKLAVSEKNILCWRKVAELAELKGMGAVNASLLNKAGIKDIPELSQQNPTSLHGKLLSISTNPPRAAIISVWIRAAQKYSKLHRKAHGA